MAERFMWHGMRRDIRQWCEECPDCQASKIHRHTRYPLTERLPPSDRLRGLRVDMVGPFSIHIITNTLKKTSLYKDRQSWKKKQSDFDITMGNFDRAETCELVGPFLLSQLEQIEIDVGLYRDEDLVITRHKLRQFLLSNTTLNVKISGANTEEPFLTNIGTPQGDSLSPVLFIIYLEQALKNVRSTLDSPSNTTEAHLRNEIVYADDIDFIGNQPVNVKEIEETLKVHKLKVNVDKTEHTSVRKHSEEWKTSKKVGSPLGSKEDIEHRKHLSNIALNKMEQIWYRAEKPSSGEQELGDITP
ncbi:Gag pol polyprotein [Elysia marginata]|uniref:Gag pol polyprotein n=1 Tax=Elysia marginata TaxID=1093978 RepID=A0AAV4IXJ6_9GAST|nr:Gag pol polyprotein [Elysia marginata]